MVAVVSAARQMSPQTGSIKEKIRLTITYILLQIHKVVHLVIWNSFLSSGWSVYFTIF